MKSFHSDISAAWQSYSLFEQMAHIGAEVGRTLNWKKMANDRMYKNALYRALELIDATVEDKKNKNCSGELLRVREVFLDYCVGDDLYGCTDEGWDKYFYPFNLACRMHT